MVDWLPWVRLQALSASILTFPGLFSPHWRLKPGSLGYRFWARAWIVATDLAEWPARSCCNCRWAASKLVPTAPISAFSLTARLADKAGVAPIGMLLSRARGSRTSRRSADGPRRAWRVMETRSCLWWVGCGLRQRRVVGGGLELLR